MRSNLISILLIYFIEVVNRFNLLGKQLFLLNLAKNNVLIMQMDYKKVSHS